MVEAGYSAIQSQGWYLEDIHLMTPWQEFYNQVSLQPKELFSPALLLLLPPAFLLPPISNER